MVKLLQKKVFIIIYPWRISTILKLTKTSKTMSEMLAQVFCLDINCYMHLFQVLQEAIDICLAFSFSILFISFKVNISGLRAATDTNRRTGRRLVWVFLLIVCFAVMVAQITDRVRHFLSEPVSVQVSVARNNSLLYPAVTVCNKVSGLVTLFKYRKYIKLQVFL